MYILLRHLRCVRILADRGADLNSLTVEHWTPLHEAASQGHKEVVRELLTRGADPKYEAYVQKFLCFLYSIPSSEAKSYQIVKDSRRLMLSVEYVFPSLKMNLSYG